MALPAQPPPPPIDRALPKTPDPPSPPPHTPMHERPAYQSMAPPAPPSSAANRSAPSRHGLIDVPIPQQGSLLSPNAHAGLDFGFNQPQQEGPLSPEADSFSPEASVADDPNRHSRDTDTSGSSQQQASTNSSATTSASSVSGLNEVADSQENSTDSPESSVIDGSVSLPRNQSVPQLQYHHHHHPTFPLRSPSSAFEGDARAQSNPDLVDGVGMGNHLTPNSTLGISRRSSLPRPASAYSAYSDLGPRGRSPGLFGGSQNRAPSVQSRRSPENRTGSYAELLNVPYPQPAPAPINFDNSHLRHAVGTNASLLSTQKTLEMYRQNVKKTNDFGIQYSFAVFLIATAQEMGLNFEGGSSKGKTSPKQTRDTDSPYVEGSGSTPNDLIKEARNILQRLANAGYPFAQYYLADGYASGLFSKGKEDYNAAFPLFVLAAKHGHAESAYRAGLCYEFGWGCRVDPAKAIQFLRTAGSKGHPGAMTRLGKACLSGDLGEKRYKEAIKWLRLATECADTMYNAAPYILGCLYETGYGDDIFRDESYAAELFTQAAELGHPEANYRMGDAYEHGKLNCPRDPALSVHFYTGAAERGHPAAMMGLCAWYMVGADPILEKDEEEAYEWARRSAELGMY